MKCTNCGAELTGKFCTECGTPAPEEVKTEAPQDSSSAPKGWGDFATDTPVDTAEQASAEPVQSEAPAEPVEYKNPFADNSTPAQPSAEMPVAPNQYQNPFDAGQSVPNEQPQPNYNNQTSFGQQFSNQSPKGYAGQQFSNQPQNSMPNGKKPMSGGKIAVLVISIILGLIIILGIIIGVVACNVVKNSSGFINSAISSIKENGEFEFSYHSEDYTSPTYDNITSSYADYSFNEYEVTDNVYLYYKVNNDSISITGLGYSYYDTAPDKLTIEIPEKIDGKSVTEIETLSTSLDCDYLKIVVPSSVKTIDTYAFAFNEYIDEIEIKDGVKTIDDSAFGDCPRLKKVTVPASVTTLDDCGLGFYYDDNYDEAEIDGFVMYGEKGSAAETYAKSKGLTFKEN